MFKREFKINFKSLLIWSGIMVAVFALVFAVYPSILNSSSVNMMDEMLKIFPPEMLEMFNMDIVSIDSVFGWMQTEGITFYLLIGGIYAAILGGTILVKEENDKTIEYLYSKPISKKQIVTAKLLCGCLNILIFTIVLAIFNLGGLLLSNDFDLIPYLLFSFSPIIVFYVCFFLLLFISTFAKKTKKMMSLGIAVVFLSYFLQIIGGMSESFEWLKYLSVFEFVPTRSIIINESIDLLRLLIAFIFVISCIIFTYINYNKKELVI